MLATWTSFAVRPYLNPLQQVLLLGNTKGFKSSFVVAFSSFSLANSSKSSICKMGSKSGNNYNAGFVNLVSRTPVATPSTWGAGNDFGYHNCVVEGLKLNERPESVQPGLENELFDVRKFFKSHLPADCKYGNVMLYSHTFSSTQDFIKEKCLELPEGTVCVADYQTKARGRGENIWSSPPGCLVFTFKSVVKEGRLLPLMQYIVSLAIVEAIDSFPGFGDTEISIKWPNDIYADRSLKIGGILCESVFKGGVAVVTIGVGINVDNTEPTTCLRSLCSNSNSNRNSEVAVTRESLLAEILKRYEQLHKELVDPKQGFERIRKEYEKRWLHSGQQVTLESNNGLKATINGISSTTGALLATCISTGEKLELYPDGNRMDFFKGLLTRKLK
mmetsp:Transcript_17725/g.22605  ORF Transcript_17725/g.22605 Transcript_17725/m.22605 type:complete len:389 (-) Transcript_17725:440-1606(-)